MSPESYVQYFRFTPDEIIFVASQFTIQETSFYRYKGHFDRIKAEILPAIYEQKKNSIKILSAGCATGEEPYTLAMLLYESNIFKAGWDYQIIATDINSRAIEFAKTGIYNPYKLRNIDEYFIKTYFMEQPDERAKLYILKDEIKKMVTFKHANLISEPFCLKDLNDFDIIFCENVIIYFCLESTQRLINNFYDLLGDKGYLFLGYSETLNFMKHKFYLTWWNDSFAYQKLDSAGEKPPSKDEFVFQLPDKEESSVNIQNMSKEEILKFLTTVCASENYKEVDKIFMELQNQNLMNDWRFLILHAEYLYNKEDYMNAGNEARKVLLVFSCA
jgi:chemotaxis protein methyltransferase CheR